jgi:hypothetical protein
METKPAETLDMPEKESIEGRQFDTSSAFGNPGGLAQDPQAQMSASSLPAEDDNAGSGPDETLQQILKGEVPRSG